MYREETQTHAKPISEMLDLFGKSRIITKKGRVLSERATLLKYFCERAVDRKGPIVPARMGFMLQGLGLQDLYYMKSVLQSDSNRVWENIEGPQPGQSEKWNMLFWSMLKPKQ